MLLFPAGDANWAQDTQDYTKVPSATYQDRKSGFPGKEYISGMMDFANKSLLVSKAFYFFFFAAFGSLFPLLGVYFKQLGFNPTQCGLLIGFRPFVEFCSAPFWGNMADKWKKGKHILLFSIFCWILFTIVLAFIRPPADSCIRYNGTDLLLVKPGTVSLEQGDRYKRSVAKETSWQLSEHLANHISDNQLDNEAIETINMLNDEGFSVRLKRQANDEKNPDSPSEGEVEPEPEPDTESEPKDDRLSNDQEENPPEKPLGDEDENGNMDNPEYPENPESPPDYNSEYPPEEIPQNAIEQEGERKPNPRRRQNKNREGLNRQRGRPKDSPPDDISTEEPLSESTESPELPTTEEPPPEQKPEKPKEQKVKLYKQPAEIPR